MSIKFIKPLLLPIAFTLSYSSIVAQSSQEQASLEQEWETIRTNMYNRQDSLISLKKSVSARLNKSTDTLIMKELRSEVNQLDIAIEQTAERALEQEFNLVKRNLSAPVALDILALEFNRREGKPYAVFHTLFNSLADSLQKSEKGKQLQNDLLHCKSSSIDQPAPAFTVKGINGESISLTLFHGKRYVLLDFWASWCVPCRQDFPFIKRVFEKYHNRGLEIISFSTDTDLSAWRKAIDTDSIGIWKHVSVEENNSPLASQYFVTGIPVKVLIDKQGKIIARWRGSGEENEKAMLTILQSIFENPPKIL